MKFIQEGSFVDGSEYPTVEMTLSADVGLDSAISAFEDFLRAAGYVFDGHLELTPEFVPNNEVN